MKRDDAALVRLGASVRLQELRREMRDLLRRFPGLDAKSAQPTIGITLGLPGLPESTPKRARRRKMSKSQRAAVSARMKRYWSERRKAKK